MLTELAIRAARPAEKPYKLFDGRGLYLLVTPAGGRLWRLKYRYGNKEKSLALGHYPDVSLKDARDRRDEARRLLDNEVDPSAKRQNDAVARIENSATTRTAARTIESMVREWWTARKEAERWDEDYAVQVIRQFERDVFAIQITRGLQPKDCQAHPLLKRSVGEWPYDALTPPDVLEICKNIEARGALSAARDLRSRIGMVYKREKVLGRCTVNPAADVTALLAKPKQKNHAAIADRELPAFFARLDAENLEATTSLGLQGIIATWLRTTELRLAQWAWLDWDGRQLRIPSAVMKNGDRGEGDHIVPLSDYAMHVFRTLHAITGHRALMFPSLKQPREPISDGTWLNALYRMGYRSQATVHGMRALGSTTANEAYVSVPDVPVPIKMWDIRWIDRQLDHVDSSVSGRYNRAEYLEPRRALMQWWGEKVQQARLTANLSR